MYKKLFTLSVMLSSISLYAQTPAWISDQLPTTVNDSPSRNAKFVGTVSAGEAVEITGAEQNGYVPIRSQRLQGWVLSKNVMNTPSVHAELVERKKEIESLQQSNREIANRENTLSGSIEEMNAKIRAAELEAEQAKAELVELRRVSGNAIAISDRNKALQNETVQLEQRIVEQAHKIHRLEQAANKQQWLVGGGLVIAGFILQWIFSSMRIRRSRERYSDFD